MYRKETTQTNIPNNNNMVVWYTHANKRKCSSLPLRISRLLCVFFPAANHPKYTKSIKTLYEIYSLERTRTERANYIIFVYFESVYIILYMMMCVTCGILFLGRFYYNTVSIVFCIHVIDNLAPSATCLIKSILSLAISILIINALLHIDTLLLCVDNI